LHLSEEKGLLTTRRLSLSHDISCLGFSVLETCCSWEPSQHRSRRSVFLQPGVRICSQESVDEVLASHQVYYQLRVCQEAVWEAFRIFLDRIPGTWEYQAWVRSCQQEALCISDIARNFSSSEEHISLIHRVQAAAAAVTLRASRRSGTLGAFLLVLVFLNQILKQRRCTATRLAAGRPDSLHGDPTRCRAIRLAAGRPDSLQLFSLQMRLVFDRLPGFKAVRKSCCLTASPGGEELSEEVDQSNTPNKELVDPGSDLTSAAEEDATPLRYLTTPTMTTASNRQELVVFFSLRLTNMDFSEDLFNNTSAEYRALENTLLDLLPYLQANLTGFRNLEILNFRKGSVVVNSKMRFSRSVPYNVTEAVRCLLERFCSAARRLQIDRSSLDVEPADRADPCRFLACGASSRCVVDRRTQEARCLCEPGFLAQQNRSCRSVCELQPEFCPDRDCHVVPGRGAECRYQRGPIHLNWAEPQPALLLCQSLVFFSGTGHQVKGHDASN
uniref:Interphotoreceptor matrix proteoglycan 1 n=1 Tax=Xiphophorus couchianus TaxID=32473 RepID=A0A3B5L1B2_9TELE